MHLLILQYNAIQCYTTQDKVLQLINMNESKAVALLAANIKKIPVKSVIDQLSTVPSSQCQVCVVWYCTHIVCEIQIIQSIFQPTNSCCEISSISNIINVVLSTPIYSY